MPAARRPVSVADALDKEMRTTGKILRSLAKGFPPNSAERKAIQEAGAALVYLRSHERLRKSYATFKRSRAKPLTGTQKAVLKRAGVRL
jgi:hypothetical protein